MLSVYLMASLRRCVLSSKTVIANGLVVFLSFKGHNMGRMKALLIKDYEAHSLSADEAKMLDEYEQWEAELEHAHELEDFDYHEIKKGCQFPPPRAINLRGK